MERKTASFLVTCNWMIHGNSFWVARPIFRRGLDMASHLMREKWIHGKILLSCRTFNEGNHLFVACKLCFTCLQLTSFSGGKWNQSTTFLTALSLGKFKSIFNHFPLVIGQKSIKGHLFLWCQRFQKFLNFSNRINRTKVEKLSRINDKP